MQRVWSTYLESSAHGHTSPAPASNLMDYSNTPPSERTSVSSHAHSTVSQAASTRHMLQGPLDPPNMPFAGGSQGSISRESSPPIGGNSSNVSLTVNYLPSKFSNIMLAPSGTRQRKMGRGIDPIIPKRGGGVEAFKSGEARMPTENDDDYDGVSRGWFGKGRTKPKKLRWNRFKWILLVANCLLSIYSLVSIVFCLLTWFNVWKHADIVRVANRPELITSTIAASIGIITSLIGWSGLLLNNRSFLAVYTFMLWICFAFLVIPGYITFKRKTFNLEGKVNAEWSRQLGTGGRLRIQNQLGCCGYFSPFVEATVSQTCYARSVLPGCKLKYLTFQRLVLGRWYTVAFTLVPLHIAIMMAGLLCSNHVTYRFGKGMMPKAYRLSMNSMAVIMDNYANQLAEQYGSDVAADVLSRSKTHLPLDTMPTMPYTSGQSPTGTYSSKYDSLAGRAPEGAL